MTRFTNNLTGDMGISKEGYSKLFGYLSEVFAQKLKKTILNEINKLRETNKDYRLLEVSDTLIVSIFKSTKREAVRLCVGYPFPLASKQSRVFFSGYTVSVFIRDEPVRKLQREYLFNYLQKNYSAKLNIIHSTGDFRKNLSGTNRKFNNRCFYVDLYDFIGDSIIGLKFLESLRKTLRIPKTRCTVFSKHSKHIPTQYAIFNSSKFANLVNNYEYSTIIVPALIDNQFDAFLKILKSITLKNFRIIVPSRNLFLTFSENNSEIFWYKSRDVLFKTNSIDNYMDIALNTFTGEPISVLPKTIKVRKITKNVFINPFSSLEGKSISVDDCSKICEHLQNNGFNVFVSAGFHQEEYIQKLKVKNITLLYDSGFKDLSEKLTAHNIGLVISTDSGIAHMTATLGIATIVIYHSFFWDSCSKQSISNDALGGFCRAHLPMIPVVNSGILDAVENIYHPAMTYKQKKCIKRKLKRMQGASNKTVFSLHKDLVSKFPHLHTFYCPDMLLKNVINNSNKTDSWSLVSNVWQNLPAYKVSNFTFV